MEKYRNTYFPERRKKTIYLCSTIQVKTRGSQNLLFKKIFIYSISNSIYEYWVKYKTNMLNFTSN